jgi:hypothetical protein
LYYRDEGLDIAGVKPIGLSVRFQKVSAVRDRRGEADAERYSISTGGYKYVVHIGGGTIGGMCICKSGPVSGVRSLGIVTVNYRSRGSAGAGGIL